MENFLYFKNNMYLCSVKTYMKMNSDMPEGQYARGMPEGQVNDITTSE